MIETTPLGQQLIGYTTQENAYVIENYPFGGLRTKQKRWIETSDTHGQRLCLCTMNPKTGRWCAVKKSTYSWLEVMFRDERGHIMCDALSIYDVGYIEKLDAFANKWTLDNWQLGRLTSMKVKVLAYNVARARKEEQRVTSQI